MSVRDDTPEKEAPGRPAGREGAPARDPEREPLGYYYDDGTNYEAYDPEGDQEPEETGDETGPEP